MAGQILLDDPAIGLVATANLTRGKGGISSDFTDQDWIRAIRHGLNKQNKALVVMPSQEFNVLSDKDLGALIAYCKSVDPVDNELPECVLRPMGKILVLFNKIEPFSAEIINHNFIQPKEVHKEISAKYGKYLSVTCQGCHKLDFNGGDSPVPGFPPPPNFTANGSLKTYTEHDFINVLQTGKTPDGRQLDNKYMPWEMTKSFTEDEIKSLYLI
ncbi:hypothetical protein BH23BAC1_BH23BAC1_32740 [soil metagenome]